MEHAREHDEGTRPDRDRPGDAVGQEDVRDLSVGRAEALGQRGEWADTIVAAEHGSLGGHRSRREGNGPVAPANKTADHQPRDGYQLTNEDCRVDRLDDYYRDWVLAVVGHARTGVDDVSSACSTSTRALVRFSISILHTEELARNPMTTS